MLLWIIRGCYVALILGVALITLDHKLEITGTPALQKPRSSKK